MDFKRPRKRIEFSESNKLRRYMEERGWLIKKLHGGKYQSGFPDLVAMHPEHGLRWIETKAPGGKLRPSQRKFFAVMSTHGQLIFVLHSVKDYPLLFSKYDNWISYI